MDSWEEYQKKQAIQRKEKAKKLTKIGEALIEEGYTHLVLHYQGCGDSGDFAELQAYKSKEDFDKRGCEEEYVRRCDWVDGKTIPIPEDQIIETHNQSEIRAFEDKYNKDNKTKIDLSEEMADQITYDWYNNEGGQGRVIWDLKSKCIFVDGEQNTNAHVEVTSSTWIDDSQPDKETWGNEVIDRGW